MDALTDVLAVAAWWFVAVPLVVTAHELGHALVVLAVGDGEPTITVGGGRWAVPLGALTVEFDPGGWRRNWYGFCRSDGDADATWRRTAVYLGGPAASVTVLFALYTSARASPSEFSSAVTTYAFWYTAFQFVVTATPIEYPSWWGEYAGQPSDGLRAWRAITNG